MCQLNFANLRNKEWNGLYYLTQTFENSLTNKDGFGFYADGYKLTSKLSPNSCYNIGDLLRKNYTSAGPILSHVRLATVGIANKKVVEDATSHPFEGKYFVLAHNGVLELKVYNDKYKDVPVDTLVFLYELENRYEKEKDIAKCISETIDLFYGTYAFLIYNKETSEYYAVKGRTKKLHLLSVFNNVTKEELGYVLNTDALDADLNLLRIRNIFQFLYGIDIDNSKPIDLEPESIFLLGDVPKKIGSVKESIRPAVAYSKWEDDYYTKNSRKDYVIPQDILDPFHAFVSDLGLNLCELDVICFTTTGKGLVSLSEEEATWLIKNVLNKIRAFYTKGKQNIWYEIIKETRGKFLKGVPSYTYPYIQYGLRFPYVINSKTDLELALQGAKNENANPVQ